MQPEKQPEMVLRIDGQAYEGWESISVSRSIERMSGGFEIYVAKLPPNWSDFPMAETISIEIDTHVLITGYINHITSSYDKARSSILISGRDKVGDLLDCAASVQDQFEFKDALLENVIRQILKPYGIPLHMQVNNTGKAIKRLAVQPGESAFDFIERACRLRSILPISDGLGGLILTKPGAGRSPGRIVYGQNVLSAQGEIDWTERYSDYVAKGQSEALDEFSSVEEVSEPQGIARDPAIKRYRPKVLLSESQGYDLSLQERAVWQRKFDQARSRRATYTVQGFYAAEGKLWKPNDIVSVHDPRLKIKRDMLIVSLVFEKSADGTITTLELALPESFDLPAEKESETDDDDLWGGL